MTVARLWRTAVDPARAIERFAASGVAADVAAAAGLCRRRHDAQRPRVLTLWKDQAAVDALAGSATCLETVRRSEAEGFLAGGSTLVLHDVHLSARPD